MSRQDQHSITVSVDDRDLGVWDKRSGGAVDSEETKYRPGGLASTISLGGSVTVDNVTLQRLYDLGRDHALMPWLRSRVGKGQVTVTDQPLDVDGNAFGRPDVYTGVLKRVTPPDADSESSDAALVEIEVSTSGTVG